MDTVAALLLLAFGIWFWKDTLRDRELATRFCQQACRSYQVQFLDGTVSFMRLGISRGNTGIHLKRSYAFSFSYDGIDRYQGYVVVMRHQVQTIFFPPRREEL